MQTYCPKCQTKRHSKMRGIHADKHPQCRVCGFLFAENNNTRPPEPYTYSSLLEQNKAVQKKRRNWLWAPLSLLAGCVLLLQVLYLKRAEIAEHDNYGQYVSLICKKIKYCDIPVRRALNKIKIEHKQVYTHPDRKDALVVDASFKNTAEFNQPYPVLLLSLSDKHGQQIAARQFLPREYLADDVDIDAGLPPQSLAKVMLNIYDPGQVVLAFELAFL